MNRLVRIALTLFASASILIFLVLQRLQEAKQMTGAAAESELQMVYFGMVIVGGMLLAGVALIATAIIRSRKKSRGDG